MPTQRPSLPWYPRLITNVNPSNSLSRNITNGLSSSNTITITAAASNSKQVTISTSVNFGSPLQIFDTIIIPLGSVIAGAGNVNVGSYIVTGYSNNGTNSVTAEKMAGPNGSNPITVSAASFSATPANDLQAWTKYSSYKFGSHYAKAYNSGQVGMRIAVPWFGRRTAPPLGFGFDLDLPFI